MLKVAFKYGLAAAASLSFAGAVAADGYEVAGSLKDTAPAPIAYEWNGLSVGAGIGVGRFDQNAYGKAWRKDKLSKYHCWLILCYDKDKINKYRDIDAHGSDGDWSAFGTAQIGYDRLLGGRFLIGAFADYDFLRDAELTFSNKRHNRSLVGSVEKDGMWTVGGRLGFLATPRVLLYGLAGYSQMSLEGNLAAHFDDPFNKGKPTNLGLTVDENVDGWTVGGGVEAKIERRLSLKLEYRYSAFDGASGKVTDVRQGDWISPGYFGFWTYNDRTIKEGAKLDLGDTDVHSVRAVLSFKLGDLHETALEPLK